MIDNEWENLDIVERSIKQQFPLDKKCGIQELAILPQREFIAPKVTEDNVPFSIEHGKPFFEVYIFFKTNNDIDTCKNNGALGLIQNCVYKELERVGRGKRKELNVRFIIDSTENVKANYEGRYSLRLR